VARVKRKGDVDADGARVSARKWPASADLPMKALVTPRRAPAATLAGAPPAAS
jgi:hypothetical protein